MQRWRQNLQHGRRSAPLDQCQNGNRHKRKNEPNQARCQKGEFALCRQCLPTTRIPMELWMYPTDVGKPKTH